MNKEKLFICYSVPLMKKLQQEGYRYEVVGLNPESKKTFYVFFKDQKMKDILSNWKDGVYR